MTNREQAICDVARECDMAMLAMKPSLYEEDHACASFRYAVEQRERVLELEAALKRLIDDCSGHQPCDSNCTSDDCPFFRARQVLQPKGE